MDTSPQKQPTSGTSTVVPATVAATQKPLFDTDIPGNRIVFDNVYLNGMHVLRKFSIRSLCDEGLTVKFRSNLGRQVAFQLSNENFHLETPESSSNFNQLFNFVNHVSEVELEPRQSKEIVLIFIPESKSQRMPSVSTSRGGNLMRSLTDANNPLLSSGPSAVELNPPTMTRKNTGTITMGGSGGAGAVTGSAAPGSSAITSDIDENERHEFLPMNGMIYMYGYLWKRNKRTISLESTELSSVSNATDINFINQSMTDAPTAATSSVSSSTSSDTLRCDYQIYVKLRSKVCRSVMRTDVDETIMFSDCVLGSTYTRDFTLWNRSEIDLAWRINPVEYPHKEVNAGLIEFADYDSSSPPDTTVLPGYGQRRIRVIYHARDIGYFNYNVQLDNLNDFSNSITLKIHAEVRAAPRNAALVITTGPTLNFGNCYSGVPINSHFTIRNVSNKPLDLRFDSDLKNQISFELQSDLDDLNMVDGENDIAGSSSRSNLLSSRSFGSSDILAKEASSAALVAINSKNRSDSVQPMKIEELTLTPGLEKTIKVWFTPTLNEGPMEKITKLIRRTFCIYVYCGHQERKTIQAVSKVCTSIIDVQPKEVNFGEAAVGKSKTVECTVYNRSELPAKFEVRMISKVLSTSAEKYVIPPNQSSVLRISIFPRKINPDYRKQITIVNTRNPDNDQFIEVFSNNVDQLGVTFHSLFYKIWTPTYQSFMDFGILVTNSPAVRTFQIENISKKTLQLQVQSNRPGELMVYLKNIKQRPKENKNSVSYGSETKFSLDKREKLLESMEDRYIGRKLHSSYETETTSNSGSSTAVPSRDGSPTPTLPNLEGHVFRKFGKLGNQSLRILNQPRKRERGPLHIAYLDLASPAALRHSNAATPSVSKRVNGAEEKSNFKDIGSKEKEKENTKPTKLDGKESDSSRSSTAMGKSSLPNLETPIFDIDVSNNETLDAVLQTLAEQLNIPLTIQPTNEQIYLQNQKTLRRKLKQLIETGVLQPVSTISVPAQTRIDVVLVFQAQSDQVTTKLRKLESQLFFKLVEFDRDIKVQQGFEPLLKGEGIPDRNLIIQSKVCKSVMNVGHKNINFGNMEKSERREKMILIKNQSEVPLLYDIKKSHSVASAYLQITEGRRGIVRPYGTRQINFVFEPGMAGPFQEKLTVANIQDPDDEEMITVKANIRKPSNFSIDVRSIMFGPCLINTPYIRRFVLTNTSKQERTIVVNAVHQDGEKFPGLDIAITLDVDETQQGQSLTKDVEEQLESLEQKLKIAIRKGREDKVNSLKEKIDGLRKGNTSSSSVENKDDETEDAQEHQKKKNLIRKSDSNIIITLEPKRSRTIIVILTVTSMIDLASPPKMQDIDGVIEVHEEKNMDVLKELVYTALVCFDDDSYDQANILAKDSPFGVGREGYKTQPLLDQLSKDAAREVSTQSNIHENVSPIISPQESPVPPRSRAISGSSITLPPAPAGPALLNIVEVSQTIFVEKAEIYFNQKHEIQFDIVNLYKGPVVYDISEDLRVRTPTTEQPPLVLNISKPRGIINKKVEKGIKIRLRTSIIGLNKVNIIVRGQKGSDLGKSFAGEQCITITATYTVSEPKYINFPMLDDQKEPALDLGFCYVDPHKKYAQTVNFEIENPTNQKLWICGSTNLQTQIVLFESDMKTPVQDTRIDPQEKLTIMICLQPNLSKEALGKGQCRQLTGGIRFEVFKEPSITRPEVGPEQNMLTNHDIESVSPSPANGESPKLIRKPVTKVTVRITATIGQSILSASPSLIHLGCTMKLNQPLTGSFALTNLTDSMPGNYRIERSKFLTIHSPLGGSLGFDDGNNKNHKTITFSFNPTAYGWFEMPIRIKNDYNSSQTLAVMVTALVDKGILSILDFPPSSPTLPTIEFSNVYVAKIKLSLIDGTGQPAVSVEDNNLEDGTDLQLKWSILESMDTEFPTNYKTTRKILNNSKSSLPIVPWSNLNLSVSWKGGKPSQFSSLWLSSSSSSSPSSSSFGSKRCGSAITLASNSETSMIVTCPDFSESKFTAEQLDLLATGKSLPVEGILALKTRVDNADLVTNVFSVRCNYYCSMGVITPNMMDIGKVGYYNQWEDVEFEMELKNVSQIPLRCRVSELPSIVSLYNDVLPLEMLTGITVDKVKSVKLRGVYHVSYLKKSDKSNDWNLRAQIIKFENILNPENVISVDIKMDLTLFHLQCSYLKDDSVVLPPIIYPPIENSPLSVSWFAVENISTSVVQFEIFADLKKDIADLIDISFLARSSNTPLSESMNTLNELEVLEITVRASIKKNGVLSRDLSELLLGEANFLLGEIVLRSPHTTIEGEVTRICIPLNGSIIEGPTFSLSETLIEFKTLDTSGSESEEEFPESTLATDGPKIGTQVRKITIKNLSETAPLNFKITPSFPLEFPKELFEMEPLDVNGCNVIPPSEEFKLYVKLLRLDVESTNDIKLLIQDLGSANSVNTRIVEVNLLATKVVDSSLLQSESVFNGAIGSSSSMNQISTVPLKGKEKETIKPRVIKHASPSKRNKKKRFLKSTQQSRDSQIVKLGSTSLSNNSSSSNISSSNIVTQMVSEYFEPAAEKVSKFVPKLLVRGCSKLESTNDMERFELNLGYQSTSTTGEMVYRELTLQNTSTLTSLRFRFYTLKENDHEWLSITQTTEELEPQETTTIYLQFKRPLRPNSLTTYLMIQNMDNPKDIKSIRIVFDVSAPVEEISSLYIVNTNPLNLPGSWMPYYLTESKTQPEFLLPKTSECVIHMGQVFFEKLYTNHYFVIYNRSNVSLEFRLSTSGGADDIAFVCFSLSSTQPKIFDILTIEPNTNMRVYVHTSFYSNASRLLKELTFDIFVTCRLLKNDQTTVKVKAFPVDRQMQLTKEHLTFIVPVEESKEEISAENDNSGANFVMAQNFGNVTILNLSNRLLKYSILNYSRHFLVTHVPSSSSDNTSKKHSSETLQISVNLANLPSPQKLKLKTLKEEIVIYNSSNPIESYRLSLILTFSNCPLLLFPSLPGTYILPTGRNSLDYTVLEDMIVLFLRDLFDPELVQKEIDLILDPSRKIQERDSEEKPDIECVELPVSLSFRLHCIVDMLIKYAHLEYSNEIFMELGLLFFNNLFVAGFSMPSQHRQTSLLHMYTKYPTSEISLRNKLEFAKNLLFHFHRYLASLRYLDLDSQLAHLWKRVNVWYTESRKSLEDSEQPASPDAKYASTSHGSQGSSE